MSYKQSKVVVIIPAYNEGLCIAQVVDELVQLKTVESSERMVVTVIVCDNNSTDNTAFEAKKAGAHVVQESQMGYGAACLRGMQELVPSNSTPELGVQADFVVFVDGDHSMLASELPLLLEKLVAGKDLVVGSRVTYLQEPGALSPHQRFGNVLASALIRFIWKQPITDLGPFRAMRYCALMSLDMQDKRFGWTVEMQIKAIQLGLKYAEVPVTSLTRIGVSKISGTVKGTIGAAHGIFGKVFQLFWQEAKFIEAVKQAEEKQDCVS